MRVIEETIRRKLRFLRRVRNSSKKLIGSSFFEAITLKEINSMRFYEGGVGGVSLDRKIRGSARKVTIELTMIM